MRDTPVTQSSPASVSWQDALHLALRNWPALFLLPIVVAGVATVIHIQFPTRSAADAILRTSEGNLQFAINESEVNSLAGVQASLQRMDACTFAVTVTGRDGDTVLGAVRSILERVPPSDSVSCLLTDAQMLEIRSYRQYLQVLEEQLARGSATEDVEPALIAKEIALVEGRLRSLEALEESVETPAVVREAMLIQTRNPPTRNVTFFFFTATLFLAWMTIYRLELRRLNRLRATP